MAENPPPPQDEPPTPPSGLPAIPGALPPGLNADEYRRFQEFQRFQDYQRFVESQRQPAPPPALPVPVHHDMAEQLAGVRQHLAELSATQGQINRTLNPPTWQKVLRNKWLHRLVWLIVIVVLATWGVPKLIHHYFGTSDAAGGGPSAALPLPKGQSGVLPQGPHQAVADVYTFIAENYPTQACFIFSTPAARQFATAAGTSTCAAAVAAIHGQVGDKDAYAEPDLTPLPSPSGDTMTISSCDFPVTGGPRLGTFTLTKQQQGWEITRYEAPAPCPTPTSASAPPT